MYSLTCSIFRVQKRGCNVALSEMTKGSRVYMTCGGRILATKGGRILIPSAVPKHIAESIGYTNADKIPRCKNGEYFPVPNCRLDKATERLHEMQTITSNPLSPPMSANSIAMAALSPVMLPPYPKLVLLCCLEFVASFVFSLLVCVVLLDPSCFLRLCWSLCLPFLSLSSSLCLSVSDRVLLLYT